MQNMINQAYPTPLAPIQLPEPVPYVLSQVAMPNAPSMAPYYLQAGSAIAGGLTALGGIGLNAYEAGLFNTTPTIPAGYPGTTFAGPPAPSTWQGIPYAYTG